jgi:hypothetical protein
VVACLSYHNVQVLRGVLILHGLLSSLAGSAQTHLSHERTLTDCDTLDECVGESDAFDSAMLSLGYGSDGLLDEDEYADE